MEASMGDLICRCPETGRSVDLPFQTDSASLARIWRQPVRFQCPHCGKEHETEVGQAHIAGMARSDQRDPAQTVGGQPSSRRGSASGTP
jgi:hypothetical protein